MGAPEKIRAPGVLRRVAALLIRGPEAEFIQDDLDDLFARDLKRGTRGHAVRRYVGNLLDSAYATSRSRLGLPGLRGFSLLDLKLGARMLVKYPGLTVVGGLAMAFAIATGASGFEFFNQMLYPKLPLDEGHRIVGVRLWDRASSRPEMQALHDFVAWREELGTIDDIGAFRTLQRNLVPASEVRGEPLEVAEISAAAFRVTRVAPLLGRALIDADEAPGAPRVVVIGYDVWKDRLDGDPTVVGQVARLGNVTHTIVGVMPEGFAFPLSHSLWVPFRASVRDYERGQGPSIQVFGRLADGVRHSEAQAELTALGERLAADFPVTNANLHPEIRPYAQMVMGLDLDTIVGMSAVNVFAVLLLVLICGNVSMLMFARAATRESELVVRSALGASRGRIIGQLFVEALLLGALAAVVGLSAAGFLLRWWMGVFTIEWGGLVPFWMSGRLATSTYVYAALLTLFAALIAGVGPALKATRRNADARLRQSAAGAGGMQFGGVWTAVIVAQVAVTVTFPVTAFVARQMVVGVQTLDTGIAEEEYLSVRLDMDREELPGAPSAAVQAAFLERIRVLQQELEDLVSVEPGVVGLTLAAHLPRTHNPARRIEIDDDPSGLPEATAGRRIAVTTVALNFFEVFDVPIMAGRAFRTDDLDPSRRSIIVNQSFVDGVFEGRNPIGRRVRYVNRRSPFETRSPGEQAGPWHEVVGVVRDLGMIADGAGAGFYHPRSQEAAFPVHMVVHVPNDPALFESRLRAIAAGVDPTLRLHQMIPLDQVGQTMWLEMDFVWRLMILVSAIALLLSTAGIYSVTSFAVSRRTREIGVRVALGAEPRRIITSIFRKPLIQVGCGAAIGGLMATWLALSVPGGRVSVLGVTAAVAYGLVLLVVCMLACAVPTRRALQIEPTEALRAEG